MPARATSAIWRSFRGDPLSQDGFYDADLKLTYSLRQPKPLACSQWVAKFSINDPSPPPSITQTF